MLKYTTGYLEYENNGNERDLHGGLPFHPLPSFSATNRCYRSKTIIRLDTVNYAHDSVIFA